MHWMITMCKRVWTALDPPWRKYHKGIIWLAVAAAGLWGVDHLAWTGLSGFSLRKLGALWVVAASVWGSYRISRDVLRIDPSWVWNHMAEKGPGGHRVVAYALLQLARAILIGLIAIAVCVSV